MGFVFFVIFASYALGFWYGAKLVREDLLECCNDCLNKFGLDDLGITCESKFMVNVSEAELHLFYQQCPCDNVEYSPGVMVMVSI